MVPPFSGPDHRATAELDALRQSAIVPLAKTFALLSAGIVAVLTPFMVMHHTYAILSSTWISTAMLGVAAFWPPFPMRARAYILVLTPLLASMVVFLAQGPLAVPMANGFSAVVVASLVFGVRAGLLVAIVDGAALLVKLSGLVPESVQKHANALTHPEVALVAEMLSVPMFTMALVSISLVVSRLRDSVGLARRHLAEQTAEVEARQRVEASLRASEEHIRGIFELVPEAISVLALPDLEIIDINPGFTQIYGWTRAESVGQTITALGLMPVPEAIDSMSEQILADSKLVRIETRLPRKDGRYIDVVFNTRMARLGERSVLVSITRDVTDEKRLAASFHHRQRIEAMGDLVAGISHNFNNALASVLPNIEAAVERGNAEVQEYLDDARLAAKSAVNLARQLTLFARNDAEHKLEVIDVVQVVKDVLGIARETFDRRMKVELTSPVKQAYLRAPPGRLEQVFLNLCINARDATETVAEPWLGLRIEEEPDGICVTAGDNGMGMGQESLDRLGEPFFTTKPVGRGTGLGLASAYGIIAELGGRIVCTSKLGGGTMFKVYLPIDPSVRPPLPAREGSHVPFQGERILIVDDDPLVRKAFQRMLVRLGMDPILAAGGVEGLKVLAAHSDIRAVLLDLNMPGMSGVEMLAAARALYPTLPVIIVSGNVSPGLLPEANAVMTKPISTPQLLEVLRRVIPRPPVDKG